MKSLKLLSAASLALGLSLQGCVFDESGTEYKEPSANTEPTVNLNYDRQTALSTYLTFGNNSADIAVQFGEQTFRFPERSEMRLRGFGDFDTDRVWKTSTVEDSRGIKTLRLGYYVVTPNTNDISAPVFHNFAKDSRGNIFLTETAEQLKSDLGVAPFRQSEPALLFPAEVEVGESWVAGPTIVPLFYNFSSGTGWTATLIDDNATAPISGENGCIVIKYYGERFAYYLYLKDGLGVVEWINEWEEAEDGTVKPINGWARSHGGTGTTEIPYTNYGWSFDDSNPVGGVFLSLGVKSTDGFIDRFDDTDTAPINDTTEDFTRAFISTPPSSTDYPELLDLIIPDDRDVQFVNFEDAKWDAIASNYYRPLIRLKFQGKNYIADPSNGSFTVDKLYEQRFGPAKFGFIGRGTLVNEADATDTFKFVGLLEGNYYNANANGLTSDYVVFGLNADDRLPAAKPGSTYRIYVTYAAKSNNEALDDVLVFSSESATEYGIEGLPNTRTCYGDVIPYGDRDDNNDGTPDDSLCDSINLAFEFTVPDIEGEIKLQIQSFDANGIQQTASQVLYLPISKGAGQPGKLTARLYDQHDDVIRGSLDDSGVFNTGLLNALSSISPNSNIVNYAYDLGNGEVVEDAPPIGFVTYDKEGEYQITLTVTDDKGNTDKAFRKVVISNKGKIRVKNIGLNFGSGFFTVGIDNADEPDGYYDFYKFVYLDRNEEEVFEVPGDINYEIDIIDDGEVVQTDTPFVQAGGEAVVEVDLDED